MQKSLTQIFHDEAEAAHAAFPEELKNLVVIITSSETPVYVAPEIADHLSKNVAAVKKSLKQVTNYLLDHNSTAISDYDFSLAEVSVKLIALNENFRGTFSPRYTNEMRLTATFDHEIGHLIVKNGIPSSTIPLHLSECAAAAYATLRHIQRFGRETDFFEYKNFSHAMVLGTDPTQYTDDAIQRVRQIAAETDISRLSLRETAELAGKIALEYSLDEKTLEKISTAFLPVAEAYKKAGGKWNDAYPQKCIEVMWKHKDDPDIYKAGERYLKRPEIKEYLEDKAKTDTYWRNALDFIKNHQTKSVKKRSTPALQTPS
ncbi:MAG: hypothetical protein V1721_09030 [Pseudomonadota bacterium]